MKFAYKDGNNGKERLHLANSLAQNTWITFSLDELSDPKEFKKF